MGCAAGFASGGGANAQVCRQLPEATETKERDSPQSFCREYSPADLDFSPVLLISDPQNCKRIKVCVFKPPM